MARQVLRRADSNLKTPKLNVAAHAWQARGRRFESAMLHPPFLNSDLALKTFEC